VYTNAWHRLPVFSIDVRYQPGAAHQKEAVSPTTAPFRTPEVAALAAARFDPPLSPCWSLPAIENTTPPPGSTEGGCDDHSWKQKA
jgi:hypothetical protein